MLSTAYDPQCIVRSVCVVHSVWSSRCRPFTLVVFNTRMMCHLLRSKAEAENVAIIRTVPHKERSIWLVGELGLRLFKAKWSPVPGTLQPSTKHQPLRPSVLVILQSSTKYQSLKSSKPGTLQASTKPQPFRSSVP